MARKVGGRWVEEFQSGTRSSGVRLTVTRRGLEVFGWYDNLVGCEPLVLPWSEVDAARENVVEGIHGSDAVEE